MVKLYGNKVDTNGFTIVELLVTIVVAGTLITGINTIMTTQIHLSERNRDLVLANAFAEAKIESLRSAGFLGLSDGTTNITTELPAELKAPRSGSVFISAFATDVKRAVVTITYNDQGAARTHSYTTLVGELGVGQY